MVTITEAAMTTPGSIQFGTKWQNIEFNIYSGNIKVNVIRSIILWCKKFGDGLWRHQSRGTQYSSMKQVQRTHRKRMQKKKHMRTCSQEIWWKSGHNIQRLVIVRRPYNVICQNSGPYQNGHIKRVIIYYPWSYLAKSNVFCLLCQFCYLVNFFLDNKYQNIHQIKFTWSNTVEHVDVTG